MRRQAAVVIAACALNAMDVHRPMFKAAPKACSAATPAAAAAAAAADDDDVADDAGALERLCACLLQPVLCFVSPSLPNKFRQQRRRRGVLEDVENVVCHERPRAPGWPCCVLDLCPGAREQPACGGEEEEDENEDTASMLRQDPESYIDATSVSA